MRAIAGLFPGRTESDLIVIPVSIPTEQGGIADSRTKVAGSRIRALRDDEQTGFYHSPLEGRSRLKNEGLRETRKKRDLQNYSPLEGRAFRGESPSAR